ncbi:Hypothetical protein R9X50_00179100 [Acrodontium crateriforme]|uniref:Uncharacterized protein n=1 Tax=Acrodontium crateriforme TaxID=150365 RepID=A0AAQ3LZZ0_9PEZI|nr:Hypothetical protein R9X50_00179100 [Acrodontium crateriforme]
MADSSSPIAGTVQAAQNDTYSNDVERRANAGTPMQRIFASQGETEQQHAAHACTKPTPHWGLEHGNEDFLFYCMAVPSWILMIVAAALAPYYRTSSPEFIGTMSAFLALHWAAWLQTAVGMLQRASWVRDESDLEDRRTFLRLAVRLNRLMMPTAGIALAVFIQAYARRHNLSDLAYWLLFLLTFIWNMVFSVMNAYNNITWENDRLREEGEHAYESTFLAILGIPS